MHMKKYFLFVLLAMFLVGCDNYPSGGDSDDDGGGSNKSYVVTGEAKDVTYKSVTLYGEVNVEIADYDEIEWGVMYSTDMDELEDRNGVMVACDDALIENAYRVELSDLVSETQYYYCAYINLNNKQYKFGSIKNFTTLEAPEFGANIEDGCYVVGEACPIKSIDDQDAMLVQMAQGVNGELVYSNFLWEESKRNGMWEKYIWLEANKEFELILKEGNNITHFGADLSLQPLYVDVGEMILGYKGYVGADQKMMVSETGFYHIVADFNRDYALDRPQIVILPVDWSVSGDMNSWGVTEAEVDVISTTEIVWTWENQALGINGHFFKFRDTNSGWRAFLDDDYVISTLTSLGENGRNGGDDIYIGESGVYTIKLTYNLVAGDIENSYSYEIIKTSDVTPLDYSACVLEVVGSAVVDQYGTYPDETWSWGNVFPMGTPSLDGYTYKWEVVVELAAVDGFKVRTKDYQDQGDIPSFDIGMYGQFSSNAYVDVAGRYVVTALVNAITDEKSLIVTPYYW